MPLTGGSRVGPYEILSSIGAGGMGEVYRARDVRLNRDIALKILPDALARDVDRLSRFEREAQAVAALSHPNILAIHDFGTDGPTTYAAMELLEGETLRERLDAGALPVRRAVDVAVQIARGLAAAHDKGLVHRDMKPDNVFITSDGRVKILDFGLARQVDAQATASGTVVTRAFTEPGTVLGTVGYMAPEQVRGLAVDARSDIFAFGALLYEMLAGRRAFARESAAETMTAIVREEPSPLASPLGPMPPALERIVQRCLEKEPGARFRSCHDLAFALESATLSTGAHTFAAEAHAGVARPRAQARRLWWILAACAVAGLAVAALTMWRSGRSASSPISRYDLHPPAGVRASLAGRPAVAIAPDGSAIAFIGSEAGTTRVYVRRRDELDARPLPNTEGAQDLTFSPDGRWLAITAAGDVKKVALEGPAVTLARGLVTDDSRGIAWTERDDIVFAPDPVRGLLRISAAGGQAAAVLTTADAENHERTHRWPAALAGANVLLFTVGGLDNPDHYEDATIEALSLDTGTRRTVFRGGSMARYLDGQLLVARGGTISAISFDPVTLKTSGTPSVVLEGVATDFTSGAAHFSVSRQGTLVHVRGGPADQQRQLVWIDADETKAPLDLPPNIYSDPQISPDGSRIALIVGPSRGDVYVHDIERRTLTRLTFEGSCATPVWSRDGKMVYYSSFTPAGKSSIMRKAADGSRDPERVAGVDTRLYLGFVDGAGVMTGFSPDSPGPLLRRSDILSVQPGGAFFPIVALPGQDSSPALSPDGLRMAYMSETGGRPEIFVRDIASGGGQWQVSLEGGEEPRWGPGGRRLYYRTDTRLMAVDVESGRTPRFSAARPLVHNVTNFRVESGVTFDVHPTTGRILMLQPAGDPPDGSRPLVVVLNWPRG